MVCGGPLPEPTFLSLSSLLVSLLGCFFLFFFASLQALKLHIKCEPGLEKIYSESIMSL